MSSRLFSVVCVFWKPAWGTMRSSLIRYELSEKYFLFFLGCFYHYNLNNLQCINEKIGCVERSLVWLCDSSIYLFNSSLSAVQDYAVWRRLISFLFLSSAYVYFYFSRSCSLGNWDCLHCSAKQTTSTWLFCSSTFFCLFDRNYLDYCLPCFLPGVEVLRPLNKSNSRFWSNILLHFI